MRMHEGHWGEMPGFMMGHMRGGREGGERWGRHGWREHGRPFDHGELRWVILGLIAEKPRHGYEIIKAIEESFGGSYSPSPGVVYPTLTMLEEMGHATVTEQGGRKQYTITDEGRVYLKAHQAEAEAASERMHGHGRRRGPSLASLGIIRAMANLKMALRLRFKGDALTDEQVETVVAALNTAADKIEKA